MANASVGTEPKRCDWLLQDLQEGGHDKDRVRDQLADTREQNEKMEGLLNFLEEEKRRLQDKLEKMTFTGELGSPT